MDNLKPKKLLSAMIFGVMVATCLLFYSFVYAEDDYSVSNAVINETNSNLRGQYADIAAQQTRQYTIESAQPTAWAIQSEARSSLNAQYADIAAQQAREYAAELAQPAGWATQAAAGPSLNAQNADIAAQQARQHTSESDQPTKEGDADFAIQEVKDAESNNSRE
jgi:hypothetical protein